jgi:hypothetical protein
VGGASLSLLVAIFFSNLPEALVGAVAMRESGAALAHCGTDVGCLRSAAGRGGRAGPGRCERVE